MCQLESSCFSYYISILKTKKKNLIKFIDTFIIFLRIFLGKTCEIKVMSIQFRMSVKIIYKAYSWDNVRSRYFCCLKIPSFLDFILPYLDFFKTWNFDRWKWAKLKTELVSGFVVLAQKVKYVLFSQLFLRCKLYSWNIHCTVHSVHCTVKI